MALWLFVVSRLLVNDKVRDCSGRSGKGAGKAEGSVRLLLPLYKLRAKGFFVFIMLSFLSTIPVSISLTEGTGFYCGEMEPIDIDKTTGICVATTVIRELLSRRRSDVDCRIVFSGTLDVSSEGVYSVLRGCDRIAKTCICLLLSSHLLCVSADCQRAAAGIDRLLSPMTKN
jgi:hypothetical protein